MFEYVNRALLCYHHHRQCCNCHIFFIAIFQVCKVLIVICFFHRPAHVLVYKLSLSKGQSTENGNTGHTRRRTTKQKHSTTQYVLDTTRRKQNTNHTELGTERHIIGQHKKTKKDEQLGPASYKTPAVLLIQSSPVKSLGNDRGKKHLRKK